MSTAASFECQVCLRLLHEPASLPCGHSFCRRCLVQCLDHSLRCPTCRVDVPLDAAHPQVNLALAEALTTLFPMESAERRAEMENVPQAVSSPDDGHKSFPLFVLEPLMPGQVMQLYVFEPRYIMLTQRALSEPRLRRSFGMIAPNYFNANGLATHGTSAVIVQSSEAAGGRFYLTVKGARRFKVCRTWDVDGYRNAAITWASDAPPVTTEDDAPGARDEEALRNTVLAREVRAVLKLWIAEVQNGRWERQDGQLEHVLASAGPMPAETELEQLGLWGAAVVNPLPPLGVAPEIRINALEATDSVVRLRLLLAALETSLQAMTAPRVSLGRLLRRLLRRQPMGGALTLCLGLCFVASGLVRVWNSSSDGPSTVADVVSTIFGASAPAAQPTPSAAADQDGTTSSMIGASLLTWFFVGASDDTSPTPTTTTTTTASAPHAVEQNEFAAWMTCKTMLIALGLGAGRLVLERRSRRLRGEV